MTADAKDCRPVHSWRGPELALPPVIALPRIEPAIARPAALRLPIVDLRHRLSQGQRLPARLGTGALWLGSAGLLGPAKLAGLLLTGSERCCVPFKKGMLVGIEIESSASLLGRLVVALSQKAAEKL